VSNTEKHNHTIRLFKKSRKSFAKLYIHYRYNVNQQKEQVKNEQHPRTGHEDPEEE
jgi:hypothetical protein